MAFQKLTLKLDGITAGDYLTWCRDPERLQSDAICSTTPGSAASHSNRSGRSSSPTASASAGGIETVTPKVWRQDSGRAQISRPFLQADDGSRTRDLRLGKPTLYRLSYVRAFRRIPGR
jgi:hypothetical protein